MNRTAIIVALVAAFLIGASLGLTGGILFMFAQHRPGAAAYGRGGPPPGGPGMFGGPGGPGVPGHPGPDRLMPRLREALDLSDEQVAKIEPILAEAHRTMTTTRDSLRARIDRELTPEQRERWRRLEARRGFPGETRGLLGRTHRAHPGPEGEER